MHGIKSTYKKNTWLSRKILRVIDLLLRGYKIFISPFLHALSLSTVGGGCRFYPSCSDYCKQVFSKYGLSIISIKMCAVRLLRCQPLRIFKYKKNHGYDPVK